MPSSRVTTLFPLPDGLTVDDLVPSGLDRMLSVGASAREKRPVPAFRRFACWRR